MIAQPTSLSSGNCTRWPVLACTTDSRLPGLAWQPAVGSAGQDRPPGAVAAAQGRRLGDHRLRSARPPGMRLPAGVRPAHGPDRPVLRAGSSASDPGQACPGRACPAGRGAPPRHALAAPHAGDPTAGTGHTDRGDRRHPWPPAGRIHGRVPEILTAAVGAVRAGSGRASVRGATMSAAITLADAIAALVGEKRAVGYKYHAEARVLDRFEAFTRREFPGLDTLTEASVQAWITAARGRGVKPATLQGLAAPPRELARWLGRRGVAAQPASQLP